MADFSTVARPYAKAVFGIAREAGNLAGWAGAIAAAATVVTDRAAKDFLARPGLTARERAGFVGDVCADLHEAAVLRTEVGKAFLELLAENDRLAALGEIAAQFNALKDRAENRIKVTLVSASAVDGKQAASVAEALERRHGRKVELRLEVDAALLGGAVVRADDMVIDGSVQARLKRLAETLVD